MILAAIAEHYEALLKEQEEQYHCLLEQEKAKIIAKAKADIAKQEEQRVREMKLNARRGLNLYELKTKQALGLYEETLIDQIFKELKETFYFDSQKTLADMIAVHIEKEGKAPLRIEVKPEDQAFVRTVFEDIAVEANDKLSVGFKLIYENYDLNQDLDDLFRYREDELKKKIAEMLLGDGRD